MQACLCFEDNNGLTLPSASWPRLAAAVAAAAESEFPPPWDVLLAHALVDVSEDGGDGFTTAYTDAILPRPRDLTLPFCQDASALAALQHPRVADAALERRQLLERDFPDVNTSFLGAHREPHTYPRTPSRTHVGAGISTAHSRRPCIYSGALLERYMVLLPSPPAR